VLDAPDGLHPDRLVEGEGGFEVADTHGWKQDLHLVPTSRRARTHRSAQTSES
jgi:hypothetical protein